MVLGVDQEMTLTLDIHDNDTSLSFAPERALASVGSIADVTPVGPDRWSARYIAPVGRFPQVALIVVDLVGAGQHLRATTRLPLHAAAEVPFHTSPLAEVTVRVVDQTFGPVRADAQGNVAIPIVVPPGVRDGLARVVDSSGSTREALVDLQPAPFQQLMIVTAPEFEVGNFVEVSIFAVTARGEPMPRGRATLRSLEGMVHPLGNGVPGEERFLVEAPQRLTDGPVHLVASAVEVVPDPVMMLESRSELTVPLVAGRAHRLSLIRSTDRLIIGDGVSAKVIVSARDRHDNPTSCAGAVVMVERRPVAITPDGTGCGTIVIPAPVRHARGGSVEITAALASLRAGTSIQITTGTPVRLDAVVSSSRIVGDGRQSIDVRVDAFDHSGRPAVVRNLRWQAAGGHLGFVQSPQEGSYVTQFTPNRTHTPRTGCWSCRANSR
jgi:hypothetical protein